jgi:UDP:flavonoid glycosyltransferase YjiC (YdhE family)
MSASGGSPLIAIVTAGTRGDVAPYAALGRGLRDAGYRVRLATHPAFRQLVDAAGLDFAPLAAYPLDAFDLVGIWNSARTPAGLAMRLQRVIGGLPDDTWDQFFAECEVAVEGSSAVLYSPIGYPAYHAAEALGIPAWAAFNVPIMRTRAFPSVFLSPFGVRSLGGPLNYASHVLGDQLTWQPARRRINRWRRSLGLPPVPLAGVYPKLHRERRMVLLSFSEAFLPRPPEWGPWMHLTGYWFLDSPNGAFEPPADVARFLSAGSTPVYVGFGSVPVADRDALAIVVAGAARRAGCRVVIEIRGLTSPELGDHALAVEGVPHAWLLPRVSCMVHHGGTGTLAAGLQAGRPTIVCPAYGDQFFWAERVKRLGVGVAGPPLIRLSEEGLGAALAGVLGDSAIASRAAAIGERLRGEDGVGRAVAAISAQLPLDHRT